MITLIVNLPLRVRVTKKKDFLINLNQYRNAHFLTLNRAKILFKEAIHDQLVKLPVFETVEFKYFLFPGSLHELDTNNICSIADKFFSDALVEAGKLEDDNYRFLTKSTFEFASVDKANPRVEVHITGKIKENSMQIQALLDHSDFIQALEQYVRKHYPIPEGTKPEIDITAGRGDKGYSAIVTFSTDPALDAPSTAPTMLEKAVDPMQKSLQEHGNVMQRLGGATLPDVSTKAPEPQPEPETQPEPQGEPEAQADEAQAEATAEPEAKMDRPAPPGSPTPEAPAEAAPKAVPVTGRPAAQPLFGNPTKSAPQADSSEEVGGAKVEPVKTTKPVFNFGQ